MFHSRITPSIDADASVLLSLDTLRSAISCRCPRHDFNSSPVRADHIFTSRSSDPVKISSPVLS